jgi:hypothetical protein
LLRQRQRKSPKFSQHFALALRFFCNKFSLSSAESAFARRVLNSIYSPAEIFLGRHPKKNRMQIKPARNACLSPPLGDNCRQDMHTERGEVFAPSGQEWIGSRGAERSCFTQQYKTTSSITSGSRKLLSNRSRKRLRALRFGDRQP